MVNGAKKKRKSGREDTEDGKKKPAGVLRTRSMNEQLHKEKRGQGLRIKREAKGQRREQNGEGTFKSKLIRHAGSRKHMVKGIVGVGGDKRQQCRGRNCEDIRGEREDWPGSPQQFTRGMISGRDP